MFGYEDDYTPVATMSEAVREWAWNVGSDPDNIGRQWLLSDYDSWERNPHYTGPDMGHPEDPEEGEDGLHLPAAALVATVYYPAGVPADDIDF